MSARSGNGSALRQAASVAIATGSYGVSFGALATASGLSTAQACVLSLVMFTGGSQFAFAGVVGSGGGAVTAISTSGLLGLRNAFYGLQLAPLLRARGWRRLAAAQITIDESTAVAMGQLATRQDEAPARIGFWATGIGVYAFWNASTLLGAILGGTLGDPRRFGLDAAAAAAFLALLWPRLSHLRAGLLAAGGFLVATLTLPVVPAGIPILLAAVVGLAFGLADDGSPPSPDSPDSPAEAM